MKNLSNPYLFILGFIAIFGLLLLSGSPLQAASSGITPTPTTEPTVPAPDPTATNTPIPEVPTATPTTPPSNNSNPTSTPASSSVESVPPLPTTPPQEIPELGYGPSIFEILAVFMIALGAISLVVFGLVRSLKTNRK
ncbi:MAG: hypothetical protein AAGD96_35795 [Chloroflexota bacterium]